MGRHYSKSDKASGWLAAGSLASAQVAKPAPVYVQWKNPLKYYQDNPHVLRGLPNKTLIAVLRSALVRIAELEGAHELKSESAGAK